MGLPAFVQTPLGIDYTTTTIDGLPVHTPIGGPPVEAGGQTWASAWHRDAHIDALRRELAGVDHRLEHIDDPWPDWMGPAPHSEQRTRDRIGLENTKTAIIADLKRLGAKP